MEEGLSFPKCGVTKLQSFETSYVKQQHSVLSSISRCQVTGKLKGNGRTMVNEKIRLDGFRFIQDLKGHYGCVNALGFSHNGQWLCSGSDDKRILLWKMTPPFTKPLTASFSGHASNIFCTIFSPSNRFILSCGNDGIINRYDLDHATLQTNSSQPNSPLETFHQASAAYKVSFIPDSDNVFLSSHDHGAVLLWDARTGTTPQKGIVRSDSQSFNSVDCNPIGPYFVTGSIRSGIELWDLRKSLASPAQRATHQPLIHYDTIGFKNSSSAVFNSMGTQILGTVSKFLPLLFNTHERSPLCVFYEPQYRNCSTMKTCSFAGPSDEYIIGGSDDFRIYIWQLPNVEEVNEDILRKVCGDSSISSTTFARKWLDQTKNFDRLNRFGNRRNDTQPRAPVLDLRPQLLDQQHVYTVSSPKLILLGHRSIVNNVKYHPQLPLLVSSGVEKIIKLWSPFDMGVQSTHIGPMQQRPLYRPTEYTSIFRDFDFLSQDDEESENAEESPRTLALFDFFNRYESYGSESDEDDYDDEDMEDVDEEAIDLQLDDNNDTDE